MTETNGTSDSKPFIRQIVSFRPQLRKVAPSYYGKVPYPAQLPHDFDVLRVNQIGSDGTLKLVNPYNVWSSMTEKVIHI